MRIYVYQSEGQQDEEQAEGAAGDAQDLLHPLGDLHLAALRLPLSVRHASWRVQVACIVHIPAARQSLSLGLTQRVSGSFMHLQRVTLLSQAVEGVFGGYGQSTTDCVSCDLSHSCLKLHVLNAGAARVILAL